jgi:hypothetical protein
MDLLIERFRKYVAEIEAEDADEELIHAQETPDDEDDEELTELNPWHNKKTGRLSGPSAGNVYSLSKPAVKKAGIDDEFAKKGIATSKGNVSYRFGMAGTKKGCGRKSVSGEKIPKKYSCSKYSKKYQNEAESKNQKDQGHPLIPSDENSPSRKREKLYPGSTGLFRLAHGIAEDGEDTIHAKTHVDNPDDVFISLNDLLRLLNQLKREEDEERRLMEIDNNALMQKCRQLGMDTRSQFFQNLVRQLDLIKRAQDGKLFEPSKK